MTGKAWRKFPVQGNLVVLEGENWGDNRGEPASRGGFETRPIRINLWVSCNGAGLSGILAILSRNVVGLKIPNPPNPPLQRGAREGLHTNVEGRKVPLFKRGI
jgi:hypothetical protein